jgi:hypothetical protein
MKRTKMIYMKNMMHRECQYFLESQMMNFIFKSIMIASSFPLLCIFLTWIHWIESIQLDES